MHFYRSTILILLLWTAAAEAQAPPRLQASAIDSSITLDGRFDEAAWQAADVATDFIQREPVPGAPAEERTEIRVVYDERTLYFAVRAFDSEPAKVIAREMQRDGALFRDDGVILLLDTFDDDRNAYFFETNPLGARTDALITDEGRDMNFDWDGVWDVVARRDDQGWTAEIAIPFSTLRFDPQAQSWGFNVRRTIRRKNQEVFWAPIPLEAGLDRVSLYGELTDIRDIRQGWSLNVKPFVSGRSTQEEDLEGDLGDAKSDFETGLDVKWGVTRGLSLDLTVNTDFAETEVDEQQVNLTRFSLFFPEKREFFLENAGIFAFGPRGGSDQLFQGFFSRRIGIDDNGNEVPLDGGVRLSGRAGEWNLGILGAFTGSLSPDPGDDFSPVPSTDWGALRVKRNVGSRSSVGMIYTDKNDGTSSNRVYGVDFDWKPTTELAVSGFASASDDDEVGSDEAFGVDVSWNSAQWEWRLGGVELGERYEPEMGFLRRQGRRRWDGGVEWRPRSQREAIRDYSIELEGEVFETLDGQVESYNFGLDPFGLQFANEDRGTTFYETSFERLFEPFEIVDGIVIPAGEYRFDAYGIRFATSESRPIIVRGRLQTGEFFDGDRDSASMTVVARPSRFIRTETRIEWNQIDLPGGSFESLLVRERFGIAWNPNLRLDTFIQYNDLNEQLALNMRFNWIYRPGADLFVVYNESWHAPSLSDLTTRDRQVIVKWTWLFQR